MDQVVNFAEGVVDVAIRFGADSVLGGRSKELLGLIAEIQGLEGKERDKNRELADHSKGCSRVQQALEGLKSDSLLEREELHKDMRPIGSQVIYQLFALVSKEEWLRQDTAVDRVFSLPTDFVLAYWLAKGSGYRLFRSTYLNKIKRGEMDSLSLNEAEDQILLTCPKGVDFFDHVSAILRSLGPNAQGSKRLRKPEEGQAPEPEIPQNAPEVAG